MLPNHIGSLTVPSFALPETNTIVFHCGGTGVEEIMRLDKQGMTYKGQRIEDAGEAHRAFIEAMGRVNRAPNT